MAKWVKKPPAIQEMLETQAGSPNLKDSLAEGMATHSSILAWRIPWTEEPGELQSKGCKESDANEATEHAHTHTHTHTHKETTSVEFTLRMKG